VLSAAPVPEDGGALLTWVPPASDGGEPLVAFFPRVQNETATLLLPPVNVNDSASVYSTSVRGLSNGDRYTVSVVSLNGGNVYSVNCSSTVCSQPVIPCGLPGAPPAAPNVTGGNDSVTLAWGPPSVPLLCAVTDYVVCLRDGSGTLWQRNTSSSGTSFVWSGPPLVPGGMYTASVAAVNAMGAGPPSAAVNVRTCGAPGQPAAPSLSGGDGSLAIDWAFSWLSGCPSGTVGTFVVEVQRLDPVATLPKRPVANTTHLRWRVGLRSSTRYQARVAAVSSVGQVGIPATTMCLLERGCHVSIRLTTLLGPVAGLRGLPLCCLLCLQRVGPPHARLVSRVLPALCVACFCV
jgi:hypothetical protein